MQAEQGVNTVIRRVALHFIAFQIEAVVIILRAHAADHQLHRAVVVVQGEDVVLRGVFAVFDITKGAAIEGEVTARLVAPLHVVYPGAGPGEENHIGVDPVDIKVIAVEAFPRPDGGVFERAAKARQMADLRKGLAQVEIAAGGGPVVIGALAVGKHHFKAGGRAVGEGLFMFEVHLDIGIRFVTQTTHMAAGLTGWRDGWAALSFARRIAHQQAGAGIAVELKAAFIAGFLLQFGGALLHLCCGGIGFLLGGR